jgi:hypothetical protein
MFAVDHILLSDDLVDAPFACNLGACRGGCCVQGDAGAPLEADERASVEAVLPVVRPYLRPEALRVIAQQGAWEEEAPGHYVTTCVDGADCVFVTYEGPVAKCAIQKAFYAGRTDFPKPLSCHLFPIRVHQYGDQEVLNYEPIGLCNPARIKGERQGIQVADFLREPLIRKYGEAWYARFRQVVEDRRAALMTTAKR